MHGRGIVMELGGLLTVTRRMIAGLLCFGLTAALLSVLATQYPSLATGWPPSPHVTRLVAADPQIAVLGDSVAYGAHDTVRGGWVTRLERLLASAYPHAHLRVRNLAGNGGNMGNLATAVRRLQHGSHPKLVIIAFGLNDFDEHIPRTVLAAHLRAGLGLLHAWRRPPAVVLMGLPPITALSPARQRAERAYTDVIRRVAAAEQAGYLDEFDLWLALGDAHLHSLRYDTEHPNRFGYAFTAAGVAAFLAGPYLDSQGRIRPPRTPPSCAATLCGS